MSQSKPTPEELDRYAAEYVENGGNKAAAWRATFPKSKASDSSSWANAATFHKLPGVDEAVEKARKEAREKAREAFDVRIEDVLAKWWAIANADPRELSRVEHVACRYCHGFEHEYHWTDEKEFARSEDEDENADDWGGYGYTENLRPHPGCPRCHGHGETRVRFADVRDLSPEAAQLYDGVEQTKHGLKVRHADRMAAMRNLVHAMGGFTDNFNLRSPDGSMTPTIVERRIVDPKE